MFTNRITRYAVSPVQSTPPVMAGFAACPALAVVGEMQQMAYRLAYEQAQRQVAVQRRLDALRSQSHLWN